jgi:O-6-methylguanine DNA methyltransferase
LKLHVQKLRVPLLGSIRIAATEHGVVGVRLDDDDETFRDELAKRFPGACWKGPNAVTQDGARVVRAYLAGGAHPEVDVVIPEKGFTARVWRQIARIPYGEVRSYGRLAKALRRPQAARAVGQACGRNPLPLVIPCHRVVASDGSLGGFSAGLETKQKLLALEQGSR